MKKEFGKWLLDVAKYVATAVIVSNVFTEMKHQELYIVAIITVFVLVFWGLFFVREPKPNKRKVNNKKR